MLSKKMRKLTLLGLLASTPFLTACTPEEQAFVTGAAVGGVVGAVLVDDHPRYYDRPFYYYRGRYYYGGRYYRGYYYYRGHRYYGGHYYHKGYRYYNGRRYKAKVGRYGYYRNRHEYERYHTRNTRNTHHSRWYSDRDYYDKKNGRTYRQDTRYRSYDIYR